MTAVGAPVPGWLLDLGERPRAYAEVLSLQRALHRARQHEAVPDVLMLLEHRPVVTLGRSTDPGHLLVPRDALAARGIEVYDIERGGSATYHGPGQLVGYPIVDLRRLGDDVGRFMRTLEAAVIEILAGFGITAARRRGAPGVWVDGAKICAVGVAVRRHVTLHGFALNVTTDLDAFTAINPCGLGLPVTSMAAALGRPVAMAAVRRAAAVRLAEAFGLRLEAVALPVVDEVLAGRPRAGAALPTDPDVCYQR